MVGRCCLASSAAHAEQLSELSLITTPVLKPSYINTDSGFASGDRSLGTSSREMTSSTTMENNTAATSALPEVGTTLDSHGRPARKRSLLDLPQSSSQTDPQSSRIGRGPGTATAHDSADNPRESNRSLTEKRRTGSIASSHRSRRAQNRMGEKEQRPAPATNRSPLEKPKKRGVQRFLSLFSCCGVPDSGHAVDADEPEPARKVNKDRIDQNAPIALSNKQDINQVEAGPVNSMDRFDDEKARTASAKDPLPTSDTNSPATVQNPEPSSEKPMSTLPPTIVSPMNENVVAEKPLPASPIPIISVPYNSKNTAMYSTSQPADAEIIPISSASMSEEAEQEISDRTPEQKQMDDDIENSDTGPSVPLISNENPTAVEENRAPTEASGRPPITQVFIPPPPAPSDRQIQPSQSDSERSRTQLTTANSPVGGPKWLLPPIRPEMRDKKCLVLDLDETLVHSSFKVSLRLAHFCDGNIIDQLVDPPPSRFHNTC